MSTANRTDDAATQKWGVFLALGCNFDLRAWDARLASLPSDSGARQTALRHREGLLRALESRDYDAVEDKIELMVRTTTMAIHQKHAQDGVAIEKARSQPKRKEINEWIARQLRREPSAKSPTLWERAPDYVTDQIEYGRFQKRVTDVRKELKTDASQ